MATRRDIRELALQALYHLDARHGDEDQSLELLSVDVPMADDERAQAMELARQAWDTRDQADAIVYELAPTWPTSRQPAVDRAILRLAYCEMACGRTPARAAINEAVELAKRYSTERSPAFINGVLDKIMRRLMVNAESPMPNDE